MVEQFWNSATGRSEARELSPLRVGYTLAMLLGGLLLVRVLGVCS